jgi:hypothetical protein
MKHIRTFETYRINKNREEIIRESVLQVNDIYKVKTMIDIPQSLINSYVKKVKDTTGKNLRQFFGDVDIAEEIVKYINMNFLDVEKIPGGAIMGGQIQAQPQGQVQTQDQIQTETQPQGQAQTQDQTQVQTETQPQGQVQTETQPQGQVQEEDFEEPQGQAQEGDATEGQAQEETEGDATEGQAQEETEELPI